MKGTLLKTERKASKYGGHFWYFFFKLEDGKSARSCIGEKFGNFARWKAFCGKSEVVLDGLAIKAPGLIDADCFPKIIEPAAVEAQ